MKKKFYVTALFVICSFIGSSATLLADNNKPKGPKDGTNPPKGHPDPAKAPFDGGLSLLVAAGVGAGVKKAYDKRKAVKPNNQ